MSNLFNNEDKIADSLQSADETEEVNDTDSEIAFDEGYDFDDEFPDEADNRSYVLSIPTNDREIVDILEERYDFILLEENVKTSTYGFRCDEQYEIFAESLTGDTYGFIGGVGSFEYDDFPIGFVSHTGFAGKIANNLDEFFTLIVFCPFWQSLLASDPEKILENAEKRESELIKRIEGYEELRDYLAEALGVTKNKFIIHSLLDCIMDEPPFTVFCANKKNTRYRRLGLE